MGNSKSRGFITIKNEKFTFQQFLLKLIKISKGEILSERFLNFEKNYGKK